MEIRLAGRFSSCLGAWQTHATGLNSYATGKDNPVCTHVSNSNYPTWQPWHTHTHKHTLSNCVGENLRNVANLFLICFSILSIYTVYTEYFLIYFLFIYLHLLCACWLAAIFHGNMINFHKLVEGSKSAPGANKCGWRGKVEKTITCLGFKCPQFIENSVSYCQRVREREREITMKGDESPRRDTKATRICSCKYGKHIEISFLTRLLLGQWSRWYDTCRNCSVLDTYRKYFYDIGAI